MFENSIMIEICNIISKFMEKHPAAPRCGAEHIWQNGVAAADAIKMTADIMEVFASRYEPNEEDEF